MDQVKIGSFLRELRKEKSLTQEQLAEKFNVASRTVSRWETGSNMPDLSILIEIADFYDVDIREILEGERKSEIMEKEGKETLQKVADYAETEKRLAVKRKCIVTFLGTMIFAICIIIGYTVLPKLPEGSFLRSNGLWLEIGVLGLVGLWSIIIHENRKNYMKDK